MYQLTQSPYGKFQRYTVKHSNHSQSISFIPERGGCLLSLVIQGEEIIDGYQTPEEVDFNTWGKSGVLYPFPNRLAGGQYTWQGKEYQFPVNDVELNNALHGFGMTRPLKIVEKKLNDKEAIISMEGAYTGEFDYYPWPFTFGLTYQLLSAGELQVTMWARNDSHTVIPMGLGWHPYFQLDDTAAACCLQLPPLDMVGIDRRMIPTGKRYPYDDFAQARQIGSTVLDNCFAVSKQEKRIQVLLSGKRGELHYWQETGSDKFNYLQVFTPPYGTSVALEPMSCNVDAFNNGDGLKTLQPGETISAKAGVRLKK
jgi:aldose 1-epimerase